MSSSSGSESNTSPQDTASRVHTELYNKIRARVDFILLAMQSNMEQLQNTIDMTIKDVKYGNIALSISCFLLFGLVLRELFMIYASAEGTTTAKLNTQNDTHTSANSGWRFWEEEAAQQADTVGQDIIKSNVPNNEQIQSVKT